MAKSHYPDEIILNKNGKEIVGRRFTGSVIDPVGCVYDADGEIYRVIKSESVRHVKQILALSNIEELFEVGLVRTEIANITSKGYSLVLKHERIPFKSLPYEWAPNMLIDVSKMICNLGLLLHREGFSYKDGNLPNSTFFHSKPVFFDFGSIIPSKALHVEPKTFPMEFSGSFISELGRFTEEHTINITRESLFALREKHLKDAEAFFSIMVEYLDTADYRIPVTEWAGYGGKRFVPGNLNPKQHYVYDTLKKLYERGMRTIVDVGGSKGAFTEPAADLGYECVAFDLDTKSVMVLYERLKKSKKAITPLLMDFLDMTPQIRGHKSAAERLRSDISLYLAVTHHLSLGVGISVEEQARILNQLTEHYCLVEFIPWEDRHVGARGGWKRPVDYTIEGFSNTMKNFGFKLEQQLPSAPTPRVLLLYGRK